MVKLTERLVLARSRASDLENVRKLNCWASELSDVSIIRKMPNVQIVSLSVNQLRTLNDFSESVNLEELYIRKNEIHNLEEIWHLRKLPRLRVLWLADNPCANDDKYRMTVLKTLPNLQRLDNVPVTEDEVNEAIVQGIDLEPFSAKTSKTASELSPCEEHKSDKIKDNKDSPNPEENVKEKVLELEDGSVDKKSGAEKELTADDNEKDDDDSTSTSTIESVSSISDSQMEQQVEKELVTEEITNNSSVEKEVLTPNLARVEMNDDVEDELDQQEKSEEESLEEGEVIPENPYKETNEIRQQLGLKPLSEDKVMQPVHSRPSHRTKVRNSNILQAVLHLIKELDDDSLEVVSDAIRDKLESS